MESGGRRGDPAASIELNVFKTSLIGAFLPRTLAEGVAPVILWRRRTSVNEASTSLPSGILHVFCIIR